MSNVAITLIALVITIITLIIIIGVALNFVLGKNGIIENANWSRFTNNHAHVQEIWNLDDYYEQMENVTSKRIQIADTGEMPVINKKEKPTKGEKIPYSSLSNSLKKTLQELEGIITSNEGSKLELYEIDLEKAGVNVKDKYVVNLKTNNVYKWKAQKHDGKLWHTPKYGVIGENEESVEYEEINIREGDIVGEFDPNDWTKGKVKTTIKINNLNDQSQIGLKYSKDNVVWVEYGNTPIESTKNESIYVQAIYIPNKETICGATIVVDKIDDIEPTGSIEVISQTSSEIEIRVNAEDNESGIKGYYYSIDGGEYGVINISNTYKFEGLTQGIEHSIKVKVEDKVGNYIEIEGIGETGNVLSLQEGDIEFEYTPNDWTNDKVQAKAKVKSGLNIGTYELRTSKDGETWNNTDTQEFTENGKIYAVLTDGTNYGGSATGNVDKIDKVKPEGSIEIIKQTSKTVEIRVDANDNESGIKGYYYSIDGGSYSSISTSNTHKFSGLTAGIEHSIKVKIEDKAGNQKEITDTGETVVEIQEGDIQFEYTPNDWTNGTIQVKAKIKTGVDIGNYKINTSKDGEHWAEVDTQTFNENGTMYVVLVNGINYKGSATSNVDKIDKIDPTGSIEIKGKTSNTIDIEVNAQDSDSGIKGYYYSIDGGSYGSISTSNTHKFSGLTNGVDHSIKVKIEDRAGNTIEIYGNEETDNMPTIQEGDIQFEYTPNDWTNGTVQVKAKIKTGVNIGNFYICTSKDEENWSQTDTQSFAENGTIYAVITDGTNYATSATAVVDKIDKVKPEGNIEITNQTSSTIVIRVNAEDSASGIKGYYYSIDGGNYSSITSSNTHTFGGLTQGIEHSIMVKIEDKAGNYRELSNTGETGRVLNLQEGDIEVTFNPNDWAKQITATATIKAEKNPNNYAIKTSKDGTNWSNTNSQTYTANGVLYVVLTDGTNYGGSATINVDKIDRQAPVITELTSTESQITIKATDSASGINGYYISTSTSTPSVSSFITCTNTTQLNLTPSTNYIANTQYYVWVKDKAGNISECVGIKTKEAEIPTTDPIENICDVSEWTTSYNKTYTAEKDCILAGWIASAGGTSSSGGPTPTDSTGVNIKYNNTSIMRAYTSLKYYSAQYPIHVYIKKGDSVNIVLESGKYKGNLNIYDVDNLQQLGGNAIFIDTSNYKTNICNVLSWAKSADYSYTATENCIVCGWIAEGGSGTPSNSVGVSILYNNTSIARLHESESNYSVQYPIYFPLKKNDTIRFLRETGNFKGIINVYGIKGENTVNPKVFIDTTKYIRNVCNESNWTASGTYTYTASEDSILTGWVANCSPTSGDTASNTSGSIITYNDQPFMRSHSTVNNTSIMYPIHMFVKSGDTVKINVETGKFKGILNVYGVK